MNTKYTPYLDGGHAFALVEFERASHDESESEEHEYDSKHQHGPHPPFLGSEKNATRATPRRRHVRRVFRFRPVSRPLSILTRQDWYVIGACYVVISVRNPQLSTVFSICRRLLLHCGSSCIYHYSLILLLFSLFLFVVVCKQISKGLLKALYPLTICMYVCMYV